MKNLPFFVLLFIAVAQTHAQGVAIGSGTPTPAASALLDLQSTTQGLLPPRMTTAQRTAIASPATGLVVYDTSLGGLYLRTSAAWVPLTTGSTAWGLSGNAGTNPASNFLGTTDLQPLLLRVVNQPAGYVDSLSGNASYGHNALGAYSASAFNHGTVAIGDNAMQTPPISGSVRTGNTALGSGAMRYWNNGGSNNTMLGSDAGRSQPTHGGGGNDNVGVGHAAMSNITPTCGENTAVGMETMTSGSNASFNTAVGFGAMNFAGNSSHNVAVGAFSLETVHNLEDCTSIGYQAGISVESATGCTAIGTHAAFGSAFNATAIGYYAFADYDNTLILGDVSGNFDPKVGIGTKNPGSKLEVANGGVGISNTMDAKKWELNYDASLDALAFEEAGSAKQLVLKNGGNVGIGTTSPTSKLEVSNGALGLSNTVDSKKWELNYDAALDVLAFEETGAAKRLVVKNGGNVGIGTTNPTSKLQVEDGNLALNNTADSKRWELGYEPSGAEDYFYIDEYGAGRRFAIKAGGNVGIGVTNPGQKLQVAGNICASGTIGACSDRRFKKDIAPLTGALDKVRLMRGVSYTWRTDEFPERAFSTDRQIGFIAQDIERLYPEAVQRDGEGYLSVDYARLVPVLVEAIKEQQTRIEEQQRANIAQQARLDAQAEELRAIRTELRSMSVTSSKNP